MSTRLVVPRALGARPGVAPHGVSQRLGGGPGVFGGHRGRADPRRFGVVLVVWVYYAAQIFFFGAELTQAYARRHGSLAVKAPGSTEPASAKTVD